MAILKDLNFERGFGSFFYNTNTLYDLVVGSTVFGRDKNAKNNKDCWLINGGITIGINAIIGKGKTYKSTLMGSLLVNVLSIYKDSDLLIIDTEDSISRDEDRLNRFAEYNEFNINDDNIQIISGTDYDIDKAYKKILEICELKEKYKKDLIVETPFIDKVTNKNRKMWIPTFIFIDSFSEMEGATEEDFVEAQGIGGKKTKMIWMNDGNNKTVFIRRMRKLCEKYGLCLICSAHIGKNNEMDNPMPTPKQLQYMNQDEKMKRVGALLEYLSSILIKTSNLTILKDSNKNTLYDIENANIPVDDLNEVIIKTVRTNNVNAGKATPFVISQSCGFLGSLTNYHYLRSMNYRGLIGSAQKHKCVLKQDVVLSRNTIRTLMKENYELRRAIELTTQYVYIKYNYNTNILPFDFSFEPEEFLDKLNKNSIKVNDILNSRGYWSYSKEERPYMSLFDVLSLLTK